MRLVQAAYHTRSLALYTKLGFTARASLACMQGPAIGRPLYDNTIRPATADDVEACDRLCTRVHGHHRHGELMNAVARGSARVVEHGGRVTGYSTGVGITGHSVATGSEALAALIAAAPGFEGPGFLVPASNAALFRFCLENGLRVVQVMTLMSAGLYNEPQGAWLPSVSF